MGPLWRVDMLGTLQARSDDLTITRFRTRRVGMLLAYLTYFSDKSHDRAEIAEWLWPEGDPEKTSASLRQALATLRRHVEPAPFPTGSVIRSHNFKLSIPLGTVDTDVAEFERGLAEVRKQTDPAIRRQILERVVELYKGELLPGYTEEWVLRERTRLEDLYTHALRALAESARTDGHADRAIDALHRALAKDPFNETLYADLIRLLLEAGQTTSALEHYREIEKRLADELGMEPDEPLRPLAREAKRRLPEEVTFRNPSSSADPPSATTVRLPAQLTRLFGRQDETAFLALRVDSRPDPVAIHCHRTLLLALAGCESDVLTDVPRKAGTGGGQKKIATIHGRF